MRILRNGIKLIKPFRAENVRQTRHYPLANAPKDSIYLRLNFCTAPATVSQFANLFVKYYYSYRETKMYRKHVI